MCYEYVLMHIQHNAMALRLTHVSRRTEEKKHKQKKKLGNELSR